LNTYVTSKLSWDASLDMDTLIADYMDAMYLEASDEMMAIFEKWQSIYASKLSGLGLGYEKPGSKMTYKLVDELLTLFDNAYAAIEQYKGDTELYNKLKRHIDAEYVAPAKIACVEFKKYFDGSYFWYSTAHDYSDIAANFKAIVADLGMTYANEFNAISTITGSL